MVVIMVANTVLVGTDGRRGGVGWFPLSSDFPTFHLLSYLGMRARLSGSPMLFCDSSCGIEVREEEELAPRGPE